MGEDSDDRIYYVISDLHIGGDEQLEEVEFLDELLDFLGRLAETDEDAELVINGDAFGLWEFTKVDGLGKFDVLTDTYPELFEQLARTGANVDITLLPGNHDHELAAYDEYVERFAEYNVDLVQGQSLTRVVGDQVVHFEHGHQHDPNNAIEAWGDPNATPLGYYYNTLVTSRAGQLSDRGRYNWLKDVQAVTPTERMPVWLLSKYFYREMNPVLRYALVPLHLRDRSHRRRRGALRGGRRGDIRRGVTDVHLLLRPHAPPDDAGRRRRSHGEHRDVAQTPPPS